MSPHPGSRGGEPRASRSHVDHDDFLSLPARQRDLAGQAQMLKNRLHKRDRHLGKWARREGITCYRVYDRDIPEIPLAVDRYGEHVHIARYARQDELEDPGEPAWLEAMAQAAAEALGVSRERVYIKARARQKGTAQYQRLDERGERIVVTEGGHRFYVNLNDYLDTGLFLDHRITRARIESEARGARFLNLFCYTGAFTVYAAAGGARSTLSVDLSVRYLDWAEDNMELNRFMGPQHRYLRADAMAYLREPVRERFDLALLDPPTFSTSKKMDGVLDIQRDHVELIDRTLERLRPGGVLYFSTNFRRFKLDIDSIPASEIVDISAATIPPDFRNQRIHQCWRMVR